MKAPTILDNDIYPAFTAEIPEDELQDDDSDSEPSHSPTFSDKDGALKNVATEGSYRQHSVPLTDIRWFYWALVDESQDGGSDFFLLVLLYEMIEMSGIPSCRAINGGLMVP
jgi:hypothetical protein